MQPVIGEALSATALTRGSTLKQNLSKISQAAKDFEGLLLTQMLRSAREAGGGGWTGDGDDSDANSTLVEMGEQQLAQALASSGALGIGKIVTAGLVKDAD